MDELKDKIILAVKNAIAKNVVFATGDYLYAEIDYDDVDHIAEQVADTLIAAGLKFDTVISHTAEFNHLFALRINALELMLSAVCDRAEVADRALMYAVSKYHCNECPCAECNAEIRGSQECIELICAEYKKQVEREINGGEK